MASTAVNAGTQAAATANADGYRPLRIVAADGVALSARHYPPTADASTPPRLAIFLAATGATQDRFGPYARFLAARGWHALTFDYRSIGESAVPAEQVDKVSMRAWGREDLPAMIDWAVATLGDPGIALVTHSIGGQVAPLAHNLAHVRAMLAVSVQKGWYRLWPTWHRHAVHGFFRLYVPLFLRLRGHVPLGLVGLDRLERGVAEDYARWTLRPDYLDERGQSLHADFARFEAPILSLSFEDDATYAPRPTVDRLFGEFYRNAPVLRAHVHPRRFGVKSLAHSGFFDPAVCPRAFWDDTEAWLRAVVDGAPPDACAFSALPVESMVRAVGPPPAPPSAVAAAASPLRQG